jgi:2-octaprenyl-6-methoxyphenol hydroxylase
MRDVATLAELLGAAKAQGDDLGATELLESYQRARRTDVFAMVAATDILNRLFGNNVFVLRALRSAGLGLVDKIPTLKRFFMNVAMGQK